MWAAALDIIITTVYLGHHLMQQYVIVKLQLVVLSWLQQTSERIILQFINTNVTGCVLFVFIAIWTNISTFIFFKNPVSITVVKGFWQQTINNTYQPRIYEQTQQQIKQPTSCVKLATWAMLYSVFSVDSFSMTKLEATMPRCQRGFMSGSMWP